MGEIRYKGKIFSGAAAYGGADDVSYDNSTSGLTATDVQGAIDETVDSCREWKEVSIATETYGTVGGYYNTFLKLGFIRWTGNATAPVFGTHTYTLPSVMKPPTSFTTTIRKGDRITIGANLVLTLELTTDTWSGGSIMYPLA